MAVLKEINLTGLASVPAGAQEHAVVTVRKSRRVEMDKTKLEAALKAAGVEDKAAKAVSEAVLAEEPDEGAVAKALKDAVPAAQSELIQKNVVGHFEDGTPVYDTDGPQLQAMAKELAAMRLKEARQPYPFLFKQAPLVLDGALTVRHKDAAGKEAVEKELAGMEAKLASVALPSGPLTAVDGFESESGDVKTWADFEKAAVEWGAENNMDDVADAVAGFRATAKGRALRAEVFGEEG